MEGKIVLGGHKTNGCVCKLTQLTCIWLVEAGIIQEGASFPPLPKETLQLYIKLPLVLFIVTLMYVHVLTRTFTNPIH